MSQIEITVNGVRAAVECPEDWTLAEVLRETFDRIDVNVACGHGVCGSCTVIVDGKPVRSCLELGQRAAGRSVTTVSGLVDLDLETAQVLRTCFVEENAFQCGFCTPGMVVTAFCGLLREKRRLAPAEAREMVNGNLCRCTGYTAIARAIARASDALDAGGARDRMTKAMEEEQ